MDVVVVIPDGFAARFGSNVGRRALEALALQEFRAGRLSRAELSDLLGSADDLGAGGAVSTVGSSDRSMGGREVGVSEAEAHERLDRLRAFRKENFLGCLDPVALIREGRR